MAPQSKEDDPATEKKPKSKKKFIPKPGKVTEKSHTLVLIEEMYGVEEDSFRNRLRVVVESVWFLYAMGAIILFNMVAMIIEIDRAADQDGDSNSWHWTETCSWVSLVIFILELSARMLALGFEFWLDKWNICDFLIVSIDTVFSLVGLFAQDIFPVSILRIFRLAKLARVSKILRVFQELRLLIAGLVSSLSAIFWGTILLMVCLLVWSMAAVLFIHPLNKEIDYNGCSRCPYAYSSVVQAGLTFWTTIVAGDGWGQYTVPLLLEYPQTVLFFIPVFLSIGMAVINLILGVIVSVAQQAKENIEAEDLREYVMVKAESQTHLLGLCLEMDADQNGMITEKEMFQMFDKPGEFRETLLSLEINREDVQIVWKIIDVDRKGVVPYEDVVNALYEVKSSDSKWMLASIKHYITVVKEAIQETVAEQIEKEDVKLEADKKQIIDKIEEVEALECGGRQELTNQKVSPCQGEMHIQTYPVNLEPKHNVKSAITSDTEQIWLNQVSHGTTTTQSDLDGKFAADDNQLTNKLEEVGALEGGGWQELTNQKASPRQGELHTQIYPANHEPNHNVKSAITSDKEQTWLNQVSHGRTTTQSELDGKFTADDNQIISKLEKVEALEGGGWQELTNQKVFPRQGEMHTQIYTAHLEPNHNVKSAVMSDKEQTWLNQVCHRITVTRSELDGILMDLKNKYEPLASPSTLVLMSVPKTDDNVRRKSSEGRTGKGFREGKKRASSPCLLPTSSLQLASLVPSTRAEI